MSLSSLPWWNVRKLRVCAHYPLHSSQTYQVPRATNCGPHCGLLFRPAGRRCRQGQPPGGEPLGFRSHDPVESHEFVMLGLQQTQRGARPQDRRRPPGAARPRGGTADVLIENYAPGTMERLQLSAERLLAPQPAPGGGLRQGLRVHRPLRAHVRHGHHGAGDLRRRLGHRRARRAADQTGLPQMIGTRSRVYGR